MRPMNQRITQISNAYESVWDDIYGVHKDFPSLITNVFAFQTLDKQLRRLDQPALIAGLDFGLAAQIAGKELRIVRA